MLVYHAAALMSLGYLGHWLAIGDAVVGPSRVCTPPSSRAALP